MAAQDQKSSAGKVLGWEEFQSTTHWQEARMSGAPGRTGWHPLLLVLFLAALAIATGFADTTTERVLLPIEVLGADGTVLSRTVTLPAGQAESVRSLWLQIHGLRYADQASVQLNA
ncbi:MAG: hypothetical protein ACRD3W_16965, partial [Terriglobales bacterium]